MELGRNVVSRLTLGPTNETPGVWSADGQKIYFYTNRMDAGDGIFEIAANGSGGEKLVHKVATHHFHPSPDGKHLMFERTAGSAGLATLDLTSGKVSAFLTSYADSPRFSPYSKFVAYESNETGREEVYGRTFPAAGGKVQISTNGGMEPRWRGDGKEIFVDRGDGR